MNSILKYFLKTYRSVKRRRIVNRAVKANQFNNIVWLFGDGRSGTTWIASLLNYNLGYREMFEPFHPKKVKQARFFSENQYANADDNNEKLLSFYNQVFSGELTNEWVDIGLSDTDFKGLLVKDVFANLSAKYICTRFPNVKPILLIRNPFAVAASKWVTRRWDWPDNFNTFLESTELCSEFLGHHLNLINEVIERNDYIEKQVLIWCIIHTVIFKQFTKEQLIIMCYENVLLNPSYEISRVFEYINGTTMKLDLNAILNKKSRVSFKGSAIVEKKNPLTIWRESVSETQIKSGLHVLKQFGFSELYANMETVNQYELIKLLD